MSLKDNPAVVIITMTVAVAGLFFTIGYNVRGERISALEAQIKAIDFANSHNLEGLLKALTSASEELKKNVSIVNELQAAKQRLVEQDISIKKYGQKNDDLKASLSELQNQLAEKQKRLDSIFAASESFELKPGQVKTLAGYGVVVGLIDVGVDNTIAVSVNNGRAKMYPGTIQTITTNGKTYRLIVKGVSVIPSSASFDFVVNK